MPAAATNNFGVITDATGLCAEDLKWSELQQSKAGGASMLWINSSDGSKLRFQLTDVILPYGTSQYNEDSKKTVDVSFKDLDCNPKLKAFYDSVKMIDGVLLGKAMNGLLGAPKSLEVAQELTRKSIKEDPKGKWPDTMKIGIGPQSKLFNKDKQEMEFNQENLPKGSKVHMILELSSAYCISKKNLGFSWRILQCKVLATSNKLPNCAFSYSDPVEADWDEEIEESVPYSPYSPTPSEKEVTNTTEEA